MRQRDANLTALAAIGPRKKRKMDSGAASGFEVRTQRMWKVEPGRHEETLRSLQDECVYVTHIGEGGGLSLLWLLPLRRSEFIRGLILVRHLRTVGDLMIDDANVSSQHADPLSHSLSPPSGGFRLGLGLLGGVLIPPAAPSADHSGQPQGLHLLSGAGPLHSALTNALQGAAQIKKNVTDWTSCSASSEPFRQESQFCCPGSDLRPEPLALVSGILQVFSRQAASSSDSRSLS